MNTDVNLISPQHVHGKEELKYNLSESEQSIGSTRIGLFVGMAVGVVTTCTLIPVFKMLSVPGKDIDFWPIIKDSCLIGFIAGSVIGVSFKVTTARVAHHYFSNPRDTEAFQSNVNNQTTGSVNAESQCFLAPTHRESLQSTDAVYLPEPDNYSLSVSQQEPDNDSLSVSQQSDQHLNSRPLSMNVP